MMVPTILGSFKDGGRGSRST